MACSSFTFLFLRLFPFLSLLGAIGFWFLELAVPLLTIRWWLKFGAIRIDDPGFARARRTALVIGIGVGLFLIFVATGVHHF